MWIFRLRAWVSYDVWYVVSVARLVHPGRSVLFIPFRRHPGSSFFFSPLRCIFWPLPGKAVVRAGANVRQYCAPCSACREIYFSQGADVPIFGIYGRSCVHGRGNDELHCGVAPPAQPVCMHAAFGVASPRQSFVGGWGLRTLSSSSSRFLATGVATLVLLLATLLCLVLVLLFLWRQRCATDRGGGVELRSRAASLVVMLHFGRSVWRKGIGTKCVHS